MPQSPVSPKKRLSVSLSPDDPQVLERLRSIYEDQLGHRISWAEVIRISLQRQLAQATSSK